MIDREDGVWKEVDLGLGITEERVESKLEVDLGLEDKTTDELLEVVVILGINIQEGIVVAIALTFQDQLLRKLLEKVGQDL